jgi:glycosyltransferase involved in cell wall biosynthesis
MKVSVVVPAFNEERLLAQSLQSIRAAMRAFEAPPWTCELIVCDNNSTDRTAAIAAAAGAMVVFEPVNQIARARNAGAARASGEWLIFVDADSTPSPELFLDVKERIEGGGCLAGGSTISYGNMAGAAVFAIGLWNATSRMLHWAAGSFIFVDAAAFRELGGFDEELFASEELELFKRLKRMARAKGRSIAILRRHPILTSNRKLRLYGWGEFFRFTAKTILSRGRTLRRREDCAAWYDGRR